MRKFLPVFLAILFIAGAAAAQVSNGTYGVYTVGGGSSIASSSAFQQVIAAASNGARQGCTIQNTSGSNQYVLAATTSTTPAISLTSTAWLLAPGALFNCQAAVMTILDQLWIAGTAGATYVFSHSP